MDKITGDFKKTISEMFRAVPERNEHDLDVSSDKRLEMDTQWAKRYDQIDATNILDEGQRVLAESFCSIASQSGFSRIPDVFVWYEEESHFMISWEDTDFFILLDDTAIEITQLPGPLRVEFEDIAQTIVHLLKNEKFYFQPTIVPSLK